MGVRRRVDFIKTTIIGGLVFLFTNRSTEALALIVAIVVAVWAVAEFFAPGTKGRMQRL